MLDHTSSVVKFSIREQVEVLKRSHFYTLNLQESIMRLYWDF